jgi:hypothetical protein
MLTQVVVTDKPYVAASFVGYAVAVRLRLFVCISVLCVCVCVSVCVCLYDATPA